MPESRRNDVVARRFSVDHFGFGCSGNVVILNFRTVINKVNKKKNDFKRCSVHPLNVCSEKYAVLFYFIVFYFIFFSLSLVEEITEIVQTQTALWTAFVKCTVDQSRSHEKRFVCKFKIQKYVCLQQKKPLKIKNSLKNIYINLSIKYIKVRIYKSLFVTSGLLHRSSAYNIAKLNIYIFIYLF